MTFFFDSSSLLKLYYQEADSAALRAQIQLNRDTLVVADLAWVELHSAFQTKVRQRVLTQNLATRRLRLLAADWPAFQRIALTPELLAQAAKLVRKHHVLALRSLDAIQLAAALAAGPLDGFFTHDTRLRAAAAAEGLPTR